jgi:hypothetical protein
MVAKNAHHSHLMRRIHEKSERFPVPGRQSASGMGERAKANKAAERTFDKSDLAAQEGRPGRIGRIGLRRQTARVAS